MSEEFAQMAAGILADRGEPVAYQAGDEEPVATTAVVSRLGRGPCPAGWPPDLFPGEARHAAFRLAGESESGVALAEPERGDRIAVDGVTYTIQHVLREPSTGPDALWWICRCAAQARGRF